MISILDRRIKWNILLVIALLFLVSCTTPKNELVVSSDINFDLETKPTIVKAENITYEQCEKITTDYIKVNCYHDVGLKKLNISLCKIGGCIIDVAKITKKLDYCNLLTGEERDGCYYDFSFILNKSILCDDILGNDLRGDCYFNFAYFTKNTSFCDKININKRILRDPPDVRLKEIDPRYYNTLMQKHNKFMSATENKTYKEICYGNIKGDTDILCAGTFCYDEVTGIFGVGVSAKPHYNLNYSDCSVDKDECLLKEIGTKKTFNKCNLLEYEGYKISCLAIRDENSSFCKYNSEHSNLCFFEFAKAQKSLLYCDKINYTILRDRCIALIALDTA